MSLHRRPAPAALHSWATTPEKPLPLTRGPAAPPAASWQLQQNVNSCSACWVSRPGRRCRRLPPLPPHAAAHALRAPPMPACPACCHSSGWDPGMLCLAAGWARQACCRAPDEALHCPDRSSHSGSGSSSSPLCAKQPGARPCRAGRDARLTWPRCRPWRARWAHCGSLGGGPSWQGRSDSLAMFAAVANYPAAEASPVPHRPHIHQGPY